jgi:hypothetical protein
MLEFLKGKTSERKLRLFACASARLLWDRFPAGLLGEAVEAGERNADGLPWEQECQMFVHLLHKLPVEYGQQTGRNWFSDQTPEAVAALFGVIHSVGHWVGLSKIPDRQGWREHSKATGQQQPDLLRDIFGNPIRPVSIDPTSRTPTVINLAIVAYEARALPSGELDTARLAVLAEALEEAGCQDADILGHLRSPGPHVRGCWPVDLFLSKE